MVGSTLAIKSCRGLVTVLCLLAVVLLAGCAVPATDEFENLLTQRDQVALNEKQRADLTLSQLERDGKLLSPATRLGNARQNPEQFLSRFLEQLYPERHQRYRIRIARLPGENALALSSGVVVVHLGLLAALQNQHQLAFVLAHEIEHINARHGYVGAHLRRNARARAHLGDILSFGSGASYRYYADSLKGVSREQELDADRAAARVLMSAGLDVQEAARFFQVLNGYPGTATLPGQPGTHPANRQRQHELQTLARSYRYWPDAHAVPVSASTTGTEFRAFRQQILQLSIADKIADLDLLAALIQLNELKTEEGSAAFIHCAQGDINYRMATTQPLVYADSVYALERKVTTSWTTPVVFNKTSSRVYFLNRALGEFETLLAHDPDSSCAQRGLALTLAEMGRQNSAQQFLQRYLAQSPNSADRRFVSFRVNRGQPLATDSDSPVTGAGIAVTQPLVDVVLHRVVDDPRIMVNEQRRLQAEIETAIRQSLEKQALPVNARPVQSARRLAAIRQHRFESARLLDNHAILRAREPDQKTVELGTDAAEFATRLHADKLLLSRYRGWRKTSAQWRKEKASSALQTMATFGTQRTRGYPQFGELEMLLLDGKSGRVIWRGAVRGDPAQVLQSIPRLLLQIAP